MEAIRHAQVWMPTRVAEMDIKRGPTDVKGFEPGAVVECEYVEKELRGTPKFECVIPPEDEIKVKYGADNGEVYAEVAASRLLWALGFGADRMYPVTVVCKGCPENPVLKPKPAGGSRTYTAAVIERPIPGDVIESHEDSGWSWVDLSFVDQTKGGAPLAQRDALKLLAVMMQHTDSKPAQQRLICLDRVNGHDVLPEGRCAQPFLVVHDVGKTFGRSSASNADSASAVNLEAWNGLPVWRGKTGCVANMAKSLTGTLEHPTISEGGRKFLYGLLSGLSDKQIRDLFEVARVTERDKGTTLEQWVEAFKQKRDEIGSRTCAS